VRDLGITGHLAVQSTIVRDPDEALERALGMAGPEDAVFATGSLYLVGDLRSCWSKRRSATTPSLAKAGS